MRAPLVAIPLLFLGQVLGFERPGQVPPCQEDALRLCAGDVQDEAPADADVIPTRWHTFEECLSSFRGANPAVLSNTCSRELESLEAVATTCNNHQHKHLSICSSAELAGSAGLLMQTMCHMHLTDDPTLAPGTPNAPDDCQTAVEGHSKLRHLAGVRQAHLLRLNVHKIEQEKAPAHVKDKMFRHKELPSEVHRLAAEHDPVVDAHIAKHETRLKDLASQQVDWDAPFVAKADRGSKKKHEMMDADEETIEEHNKRLRARNQVANANFDMQMQAYAAKQRLWHDVREMQTRMFGRASMTLPPAHPEHPHEVPEFKTSKRASSKEKKPENQINPPRQKPVDLSGIHLP